MECLLMLLGAVFAATGNELSEKVTLRQAGNFSGCPGDKLTLNCSVQSDFLLWECDNSSSRVVLCTTGGVYPMLCQNQKVIITVHCDTSNGIIQSNATLIAPTNSTTLTCQGNKTIKKTKTIPLQPLPVQKVHVSNAAESMDDAHLRIITILWNETTVGRNESYKVTVEPAVQGCNSTCVTNQPSMELKVAIDTAYNMTIITVACNGKLQSTASKPISIFVKGSTPGGTFNIQDIVFSVIAVVLLVVVLVLVIVPLGTSLPTVLSQKPPNRRDVQELDATQQRYAEIQAAFEESMSTTERSPLKMEAGRSVVYESCMFFAPYQTRTMFCYFVNNNEWKSIEESMHYSNPGLGIINGYVAAIGGDKEKLPTKQVWLWKDEEWVKYESMLHHRSDPAVVTSSDYQYVVVLSGNVLTGHDISAIRSVEVCNVRESSWKSVCSLPSPHTRFEVTLCEGILYAFADQFSTGYKCSLNALTEGQDADWKPIRGTPLRLSTLTTLEGCVICVGGANYENFGLDEIYMYDVSADSWKKMQKTLQWGRMYSMVEVCNKKVIIVGGISELTPERRIAKRIDKVEIFNLNCDS